MGLSVLKKKLGTETTAPISFSWESLGEALIAQYNLMKESTGLVRIVLFVRERTRLWIGYFLIGILNIIIMQAISMLFTRNFTLMANSLFESPVKILVQLS